MERIPTATFRSNSRIRSMDNHINKQVASESKIDLTIIILTWNSKYYVGNCIRSILQNTKNCNYEIIIIDNNSKDGTRGILKQLSDQNHITYIFNQKNRGVSKGRNQGIARAKGKFILFLDVDTIILPMAIDKLVEYMHSNDQCGVVAPRLLSPEGRIQYTCQRFPTIFTKLFRWLPFKPTKKYLVHTELKEWHHQDTIAIDWVIGACQLIRRSIIDIVGTLDENFFYGAEDLDYCVRVWQRGYQVVYHPESVVVHHEQRVTLNRPISRLSFYHLMGLCYYFFKYRYLFSTRHVTTQVNKMLDCQQYVN